MANIDRDTTKLSDAVAQAEKLKEAEMPPLAPYKYTVSQEQTAQWQQDGMRAFEAQMRLIGLPAEKLQWLLEHGTTPEFKDRPATDFVTKGMLRAIYEQGIKAAAKESELREAAKVVAERNGDLEKAARKLEISIAGKQAFVENHNRKLEHIAALKAAASPETLKSLEQDVADMPALRAEFKMVMEAANLAFEELDEVVQKIKQQQL